MKTREKYQRCLVLAGGGFRFGYYLGIHAAAVETGNAPDLLLATCGGAIAAALIQALPDDGARRRWLASAEMHGYLSGIGPTPYAHPWKTMARLAHRRFSTADRVPDLFNDYLFNLPGNLPLPPQSDPAAPDVAIVGGKLLFSEAEAGQQRAGRTLFAEQVFCNERSATLLEGVRAPASDARWSRGAVSPELLTGPAPITEAVRISIADMFYFRCHQWAGNAYTGGVIDLFPIELAQALSHRVMAETKPQFGSLLAAPALRQVLGIDARARHRHVHRQQAIAWIDTSDFAQILRADGIGKYIDWRGERIRLRVPPTLEQYAEQIDIQWRYGHARGLQAFGQQGK